jgi:hypothetical protein
VRPTAVYSVKEEKQCGHEINTLVLEEVDIRGLAVGFIQVLEVEPTPGLAEACTPGREEGCIQVLEVDSIQDPVEV